MGLMPIIFTAFGFIAFTVTPSLGRDVVPPTITCPAGINITTTKRSIQVTWESPKVRDNSDPTPSLMCNYRQGSLFFTPGQFVVGCDATDTAGNRASCSFTIKITAPECKKIAPPKNGALACIENMGPTKKMCTVLCNKKYDFAFVPGNVYWCEHGKWQGIQFSGFSKIPWPDCSVRSLPSSIKLVQIPGHYYDGDVNDPNIQQMIKQNYLRALQPPYVPPFFCLFKPQCRASNVIVFPGKTSK